MKNYQKIEIKSYRMDLNEFYSAIKIPPEESLIEDSFQFIHLDGTEIRSEGEAKDVIEFNTRRVWRID